MTSNKHEAGSAPDIWEVVGDNGRPKQVSFDRAVTYGTFAPAVGRPDADGTVDYASLSADMAAVAYSGDLAVAAVLERSRGMTITPAIVEPIAG